TLFWGTYRPNLYFGARPRLPHSVLTGLMWFTLEDYKGLQRACRMMVLHPGRQPWAATDGVGADIRHTCEHSDNLQRYGYLKHDGRYFGMQELADGGVRYTLRTEFVKHPGGEHGALVASSSSSSSR